MDSGISVTAVTATLLLRTPSGMPVREGEREPYQPVFGRYWLHKTGTAPLGDAPYTVACDGPASAATVTLASRGVPDRGQGRLPGQDRVRSGHCPLRIPPRVTHPKDE
ncbi:hypothetical protein [Streptomyces sp. NPDC058412]|uniref:hypothetical protein n=1 Tax=Streptomyces sp. NPDC058412 TaxID=3346486 RepID=UPI00365F730D